MSIARPLETHGKPVNFQACKVFWKCPWWAKLPEEDKVQLTHSTTKVEDLVNVFNAPPVRPGGRHNQIVDLRGTKVRHKDKGLVALVLGYAYSSHSGLRARKVKDRVWFQGHSWVYAKEKQAPKRENQQRWYAFFEGEVQVINGSNWKMTGNYEPITPKPPTLL